MQKISAVVPGGAASSAAVPGGAASNPTSLGETVLQSLETVEVAPMTGVQPETHGEAETGEPPYKAVHSGDIVTVIDGETLCVPEKDVSKVYYEEDDGQDVSPDKKIWSTRWCHQLKGTGVRSRFEVRQFHDTDREMAFSGVPGFVVARILLCVSTILDCIREHTLARCGTH